MCLGAIILCETLGWWQFTFTWTPFFTLLFCVNLVMAGTPIFLITWRLARRFGWRGLAVFLGALTLLGPFRDYWWMAKFPAWGTYVTGMAHRSGDCCHLLHDSGIRPCHDVAARGNRRWRPIGSTHLGGRLAKQRGGPAIYYTVLLGPIEGRCLVAEGDAVFS